MMHHHHHVQQQQQQQQQQHDPPPPMRNTNSSSSRSTNHHDSNNMNHTIPPPPPRYQIRPRPVSFGNPALETYHGTVYTIEWSHHQNQNQNHQTNAATTESCNSYYSLLQSTNRPLIEGITGPNDPPNSTTEDTGLDPDEEEEVDNHTHHHNNHNHNHNHNSNTVLEVRNMAAMVQVPSNQVPDGILHVSLSHRPYIHHVRILRMDTTDTEPTDTNPTTNIEQLQPPPLPQQQQQSYLVLFELGNAIQVDQFVSDLHGQPYTCLDDTVTCQVYPVVAVQQQQSSSSSSMRIRNNDSGGGTSSSSSSSRHGPDDITWMVPPPWMMKPPTPIALSPSSSTLPLSSSASIRNTGDTLDNRHNHHPPKPMEDFNCAVCLEEMELRRSDIEQNDSNSDHAHNYDQSESFQSILTTVCNHSFHIDCLAQWQDSPCPVCRYDHSNDDASSLLSQCHVCGTTHNNNHVCLICGIVSCGGSSSSSSGSRRENQSSTTAMNDSISSLPPPPQICSTTNDINNNNNSYSNNSSSNNNSCHDVTTDRFETALIQQRQRYQVLPNSHAWQHYNDTLHAYALCTETQHVWDFAGQGYVHRLLQNKDDGKLVEVSDPMNTTSQERSSSPGLTPAQESEVVHRKLESFANQYYTLLKSQLEQQRTYYESRLEEIRRDYSKNSSNNTSYHRKPKKRVDTAADLMVALKQERQQLTQRLETIQGKCRKVNSDVTFLKHLNESLEANRESLRRQLEEAQRERTATRNMIDESLPPLQEKVMLLMLQLESTSNSSISISEPMNDTSPGNSNLTSFMNGKKTAAMILP